MIGVPSSAPKAPGLVTDVSPAKDGVHAPTAWAEVQVLRVPVQAVLDPTGPFTERVNLTVLSDYGISGSQIKPFGGPALNTNSFVTATNTKPVIKGAQVTVSVPNVA